MMKEPPPRNVVLSMKQRRSSHNHFLTGNREMPQKLAITGSYSVDCSVRITTTKIVCYQIVEDVISSEDSINGTKVKIGNTEVPEDGPILSSQGHKVRIHISDMHTHTRMKIEYMRGCQCNVGVKGLFPDQFPSTRIQRIDMTICRRAVDEIT